VIPVAEALERLFALAPAMSVEEAPLIETAGRVLRGSVRARRPLPPFDSSAMDGYALRASEAVPGATLRVVGESAAGRAFAGELGPGEAVRIFTGAPLPHGADAVVMQEEVAREGDRVTISATAVAAHVRRAGSDAQAGDEIPWPRRLSAADVALAAAFGHARLPVSRPPEVAILSTGDELVWPGDDPGPDQVFAANAFGLHAMIRAAGGRPRILPIAGDRPGDLAQAFALAEGADLLLTIGGASVGDHDIVAPAARAAGAEIDFHKVAMRPGKPLMAGHLGEAMLLGLPGNPVSALVCGTVFLLPVLRAMQGLPAVAAPRERAILATDLPKGGPREHYLRARRESDGTVTPYARQDSSLLCLLASADCLVVQPPGHPGCPEGSSVDIIVL
jgi:molybdopterin molybdotransferase